MIFQVLFAAAILSFLVQVVAVVTETIPVALFDFTYAVMALVAAYFIHVAMTREVPSKKNELLLLSIGLILWFFGELSWAVQEGLLGIEVPFPSVADAFWVAGFVPIVAAFHYHRSNLSVDNRVNLAGHVVSLGFLAWALWVIYLSAQSSSGVELFINLFYILCSFYIVYEYAFVFSWSVLFGSGSPLRPWLVLALGFFGFGVYNIVFAQLTATGDYGLSQPIDILYGLSYLAVVVAFYIKLTAPNANGN